MRTRILFTVTLLLLTLSAIPSSAFDGRRQGFVLGGGLGLGGNSFQRSVGGLKEDSVTKGAFVTDFKIGGGFNEQFLLYYDAHLSWFSIRNLFNSDVTISSGISGVGCTWYTRPEPGGLFVKGCLGVATWDTPFEDDSDMWTGFGLGAGVGYEFAKHWAVDLTLLWGSPKRTILGIDRKNEFFAFLVTVTGLAY